MILTLSLSMGSCREAQKEGSTQNTSPAPLTLSTTTVEEVSTEPAPVRQTGYLASLRATVEYRDEAGSVLGTLVRGKSLEYEIDPDGSIRVLIDGVAVTLSEEGSIVSDPSLAVPEHELFVRSAVDLRDESGRLLDTFAPKGTPLTVTGFDRLEESGEVHMYRVSLDGKEGYVMPWYLTETKEAAEANYDNGSLATHVARKNLYGGGDAAGLDYYPRVKGAIPGNEMPAECRALYVGARRISEIDAYLRIAEESGINAFVVDVADGGAVGYAGEVMKRDCPSGAKAAANTVEAYRDAIQKLKSKGYYVIGRIVTFNDSYYVKDHPEYAIAGTSGTPLRLSGELWPTAFCRAAWQYKVDLAVEAVEWMGFHEIQFDYVRFPDSTARYEKAGTIDFRNTYGENKAQAIQRFLMYATDILHEKGVYVSADVYGESAYTYVTAYGQYWAAISGVVDVISGMPYPDHFAASGSWLPWEHPYDTLLNWGKSVMQRQGETATPAVVRTWIQAYNAIRPPYNAYGPTEVFAQIRALRDSGCTGGYMTWNAACSLEKYAYLKPAFTPPPEEA